MNFSDKQRAELIKQRGEPVVRIEFDAWGTKQISMWTHFDHELDFDQVKNRLIAIRNHLDEFICDEKNVPV